MKPYYEHTGITIYHGDCLEILPTLPAASVDLVLCDLPYGTTAFKWDTPVSLSALWPLYWTVTAPLAPIALTASQPFTAVLITSQIDAFKYCWVWEKSRPGGIFDAKNKPMKTHEDICIFSHGTTANGSTRKMNYFPQGVIGGVRNTNNPTPGVEYAFKGARPSHTPSYVTQGTGYPRSVLKIPNPNKGSVHPTQKPVALMEYLIRTYTNPGDTVLDNCMGSGTTGVACVRTGRSFIGIEIEERYCEIAAKRLAQEVLDAERQIFAVCL